VKPTMTLIALGLAASTAHAQSSVLYITKDNRGDAPIIVAVQNGQILAKADVSAYTSGQGPGGIAVYRDVRFVSQFGSGGGLYDLQLNDLGTAYAGLPFTDSYDGTSDGQFNYITDYATGDVYRTDRDYTNAQLLYNNGDFGTIGITYNPFERVLYTHSQDTSNVYIHDTTGQYVGQFTLDFVGNWRGLAFDPADSTLWITQHDPVEDIIRQVDLTGKTLQTVTVPGLVELVGGPLGAEFDLSSAGACYPDFTGEGDLDLFDFLEYVNAFNAGEDRADCTGEGDLDFFDFLCFANAFNEGC
jgi:hypothetical protein